tara:strand:- start:486 stop:1802 length:1317 start_codon:yes stop_codon:yes gene_type:complete
MGRSMLLLVSGLVILFGIIQMSNNRRASVLPERSAEVISEVQARNSTNSLIQTAIEKIRSDNTWEGELTGEGILPGNATLKTYDIENIDELDAIDSLYSVGDGGWDSFKVLLFSEATYGNSKVITEVLMRRDSFSKYSYFSNKEKTSAGSNIYFYSSDEISGPIHTNGTFKMSGSPTFYGRVSSPNKWRGRDGTVEGDASPDFQGTTDFNAQVKNLPDNSKIEALKSAATSDGLTFDRLSYMILKSDGSIDVREYHSDTGNWVGPTNYPKETHNGIISSSEKIFLEGTVSGQITIHSEEDIELYNDIVYNVDPRVDDTSTDLLGVVSEKDIIIDQNAHARTGSKDLKLHGSFMALGDSFRVENYVAGSHRGNIDLLGGIIQQTRGPVGTFGRYGITGYTKKYDYDVRLGNSIPPYFPRESVFTVVSWKERLVTNNVNY